MVFPKLQGIDFDILIEGEEKKRKNPSSSIRNKVWTLRVWNEESVWGNYYSWKIEEIYEILIIVCSFCIIIHREVVWNWDILNRIQSLL